MGSAPVSSSPPPVCVATKRSLCERPVTETSTLSVLRRASTVAERSRISKRSFASEITRGRVSLPCWPVTYQVPVKVAVGSSPCPPSSRPTLPLQLKANNPNKSPHQVFIITPKQRSITCQNVRKKDPFEALSSPSLRT